jgi:hypothetical protein
LAFDCMDFGILFKTLAVLCTQQPTPWRMRRGDPSKAAPVWREKPLQALSKIPRLHRQQRWLADEPSRAPSHHRTAPASFGRSRERRPGSRPTLYLPSRVAPMTTSMHSACSSIRACR